MDIRDLLCMILGIALVAVSTSRSGGRPPRANAITFLSPSRKNPVPPGPEGQKLLAYIPASDPTAAHGKGQQVDLYV